MKTDDLMPKAVIKLTDLRKEFGKTAAVNGISLAVNTGEIVVLLGPNGSGKTTTFKCVLGLISPTAGAIELADDIRLASVLSIDALHPGRSGYSTVRNIGLMCGQSKSEVKEVIQRVGLTEKESKRLVKTYSAGMKQRILLACALIQQPNFLVLDEPETGLDPDGQKWLRDFIVDFTNQGGSVLLGTHSFYTAAKIASRVVFCGKGRILGERACNKSLISAEDLEQEYLLITSGYGRVQSDRKQG